MLQMLTVDDVTDCQLIIRDTIKAGLILAVIIPGIGNKFWVLGIPVQLPTNIAPN